MSKRWNVSQQIKNQKEDIDASVLTDDESIGGFMSYNEPVKQSQPQQQSFSVSQIFFILIFLSLVAINAQLFFLAKRYVVKIDSIDVKVGDIQDSISSQEARVNGFSRNLISLSAKQAAFENEFVGLKDKMIALEGGQGEVAQVSSLNSSLALIEEKLDILVKSDEAQKEVSKELQDKSNKLIRKFTLYDMELKRLAD